MKALCIVAAGVLIAGLGVSLRAEEEKVDIKALIVGIWELTKVSDGPRDITTMEFTKDGKFKMKLKGTDGKEFDVDGTYVVEGDKLTVKSPVPSEKATATIKKLTDEELVTQNDDGGRVLEFKRMK